MMNEGVLNSGDKLTLIEATNGDIAYPTDMSNQTGQLQAGVSALYTFTLAQDSDNKKLFAVVDTEGTPPQTQPTPPQTQPKPKSAAIESTTPQVEYERYDEGGIGGEFYLDGSNNALTWNGTPNYINADTDIKAGFSDTADKNYI